MLIQSSSYKTLLSSFHQYLDTLGFSQGLIVDYTSRVKEFLNWLEGQGIDTLQKVDNHGLKRYCQYLEQRPNQRRAGGLSASHLNHSFSALDAFMVYLHQMGMKGLPAPTGYRLAIDPMTRLAKIEIFSQDDIKHLQTLIPSSFQQFPFALREAKHAQLRLIFVLCYACGLRRSEAFSLELADVDFNKKYIFVRQGKHYKDRLVPMNQGVYQALEDYIYNFRNLKSCTHQRVFIHQAGNLLNNLKTLQSLSPHQSIKDKLLTFHRLRHSIASHLLQNGMAIESISRFLGHSTLDTTQLYTHIVNR